MKQTVMAQPARKLLPLCVAGMMAALPLVGMAADKDLRWSAAVGLGYDSNPYRAPSDSYVNYALVSQPTINPDKKSGFYLDADAGVDYRLARSGSASWWLGYDLNLIRYLDSALENANEYKHVFSLDWENVFAQKGAREHMLAVGAYVGVVKDLYFDRDTGGVKTSGGQDISDRYTYQSLGIQANYTNHIAALQYDLSGRYETRNYEDPDPGNITEYDHTRFELGGEVSYPLAQKTKISVGYTYKSQDYDERQAHELDGSILLTSATVNYVYSIFDVSLRQSLTPNWVMYFDASYTTRTDEYLGYNDYSKNEFKVRALFSPSDALDMKFSAAVWQRDYDNAFAFDNSTQPQKEYDGLDLGLKATLKRNDTSRWWSTLDYTSEDSSDDRYAYDRVQLLVGMEWEFK